MSEVPCVVIVDGSAEVRGQIATILSNDAVHVIGLADGPSVLELAAEMRPDLVLMDSQLPGLDGFDVTRRLRNDTRNALLPIVLVSGLDDVSYRVTALEAGADDFLSRPLERNELLARVRSLLRLKSLRDRREDARQVIFALAKAAEAKDSYVLEHTERVADSALQIARSIGLDSDSVEQVRFGGLIHDVGKLAIPDRVLRKPGHLTPEEFELIKTHTTVGAEIVAPLAAQEQVVGIVRNHHERIDGAGYPDGLKGTSIPLGARIVAVCDAYDAMVNERPYRAAMPTADAVAQLVAGRDRQWDGQLVDVFVTIQEHR